MGDNLIIVESPHKATQIQGYLGDDYTVVSSKGHIRDLEPKEMSVDIKGGFTPKYVVPSDKKALVASLKKQAGAAQTVWLASDPDREGEAIAWHLQQTLGLDPSKTRRITYNEVTKSAIQEALQNPRDIDMNLVNAQQARRVLDRLVGFELSPVLWKKIKGGLSAGRVQSATLRLVVDREREIAAFVPELYYKVEGLFNAGSTRLKGGLDRHFSSEVEAESFLKDSIGATYTIEGIDKKEGFRSPAAPFTTSTLQQEAAAKLHMSVNNTMRVAQTLYEKGLITYIRTDSVNLSGLAINTAKDYIVNTFGESYSKPRQFKTKSRGAQEAHEAIRPTFISNTEIKGTEQEKKLYALIWKRTVASQMADAKVLGTSVTVGSDKRAEKFIIKATEILFDGFLKLYIAEPDEDNIEEDSQILPSVKVGDILEAVEISALGKFTQPPLRYSERTLIKKMEEIGIGRPATYASTVTLLTSARGYLVKGNKEGERRSVNNYNLKDNAITRTTKEEKIGEEKGKLMPQDVGLMVTDYLVEHFPSILDINFTANVEEDFDKIAEGEKIWNDVIKDFYDPFHNIIGQVSSDRQYYKVSREIGIDPTDGKMISAKFGKNGAYLQKGEGDDRTFASLASGQTIENISLEEAIKLFQLPRTVGEYNGIPVIATKGRFGPYLKYGDANFKLPKGADPMTVSLEQCITEINNGNSPANPVILDFGDIQVINGRYGAYIKSSGNNYKIPKGTDAATLTQEDCQAIIAAEAPSNGKFRRFKRK